MTFRITRREMGEKPRKVSQQQLQLFGSATNLNFIGGTFKTLIHSFCLSSHRVLLRVCVNAGEADGKPLLPPLLSLFVIDIGCETGKPHCFLFSHFVPGAFNSSVTMCKWRHRGILSRMSDHLVPHVFLMQSFFNCRMHQ